MDETTQPASRANAAITRRRIVESARCLFVSRGYDATSIRAVARAAGLSDAAIHYYFESKQALLAAVLETEGASAIHATARIGANCATRESLIEAVLEYFSTYARRADLVRMLLREQIVNEPTSVASGDRLADEFHVTMGAVFQRLYGPHGATLLDTLDVMLAGALWNELLEPASSFATPEGLARFLDRIRGLITLVLPPARGQEARP